MSGPNNITIQVDVSGALTSIQGTDAALKALGVTAQGVAQQIQAMSAASGGIDACTQAARDSAAGLAELNAGVEALNSRLAALDGGESVFASILSQASDVIGILADLDDALKTVGKSVGALGGMAAPMQAATAATTAATAATRALAIAQTALPILAIAAAVASLGVGLYELVKGSQENTRAFKDMDEALRAMEPTLGRAGDGIDQFMNRIAAATEARRTLMKGGLTDVIATGEQELAAQKQAIEALFAKVYGGALNSRHQPPPDAGLTAFRQFQKDGDVEALYAALSRAGGKAKEVLDAVVTIDGQSKKMSTIGNEATETREKIGGAYEKLNLLNGAMTGEAALKQTSAWNDATEALDAYGQTQDPIRTAAVAQAAALEKVADALENQAKASGDGAQMSLAAQTAAELRMRANDGLRKAEDEIAAAARRKAVADADAIKMSNFHADAKTHMAAISKLEAEGTDEARLKVIELTKARKLEKLALQENAELHQADATARAEIAARYAESRQAIENEARSGTDAVKEQTEQRLAEVTALERQTAEMQEAARIAALERDGTAEARAEIIRITKERKLLNLELERSIALKGKENDPGAVARINKTFDDRADMIKVEAEGASKDATDKAAKDKLEETKKAAQAQAEEVKKQADTIAGGWADAMFNQITGKGDSIKNWFKGLFKQIAVEALKNKIALPIVTGVLGGAAGLLGGAAGAAQQAATGVAGTPGAQADQGSILSSLSGIMDGFEEGFTKLGAKLFGTAGGADGLLGAGGTFLGSADLATGVTGGLAGIGLGATAAGLLGALGIGKGNTKGGAIGGAIGGFAGSFLPIPGGSVIGSLLGGAIGSLFGKKPSDKEGNAVINLGNDNVAIGGFTGSKFSQENRDQAAAMAKEVLSIKNKLEQAFGTQITGTLAVGAGDRDGLFATGRNTTARTNFSDDEAGAKKLVAYVTGQLVQGLRESGLSDEISKALGRIDFSDLEKATSDLNFVRDFKDNMASLTQGYGLQNQVAVAAKQEVMAQTDAVRNFRETTARLFPEALDDAKLALENYVKGLIGIGEVAAPMTRFETAMVGLKAQFEAYKPLLEEVGITAQAAQDAIATGLANAKNKLKTDFEDGQERALNEATGKGYLNQVNSLKTSLDEGRRDALAVGSDPGKVDQTVAAQLAQVLGNGNLDKDQLQAVIDQFGTAFPEAAEIARQAMGGLIDTTGEIAKLNLSFADREFAATTDTSTEAGALAAFDRQATAERAEIAKKAGADLAAYDRATAAERLRIEKDFADRRAEVTRALGDRVLALSVAGKPDAEIQMLKRKQEAEMAAAQAAGWTADQLLVLSGVLDGEMNHAVYDLAKRRADAEAEVTRSLGDRVLALSVTGKPDAEIQMLKRKQEAEMAAAQAAGWTADQLTVLAGVLDGEMNHAVYDLAKRQADAQAEVTRSLGDRTLALSVAGKPDAEIKMLERKQQAEMAAAKAAGWTADQLKVLAGVLDGEMAQATDALEQRRAEVTRGLDDRAFALSVADRGDGEILLLERRQNAEFEAAKAAGYTHEQLEKLADVLAGEMTQAVKAVLEQTDALNLSIQDRLFAAGNDTSTLDGSLAAFDRQVAKERKEIARTAGADLISFDKAVGLERQAIQKQFAEQAAAVNLTFADRLFAATNKADTAAGALAAFDRQAARDRAEAARTAGVDMLGVEQALAAERLNILQGFADQARDTLVEVLNREAEAARTLAASWQEAGGSIRDALKADQLSSQYSSLNPEDQAKLAEDELRRLSALANDGSLTAQERLEAAQALPEARRAFLDAVRPLYEGTERWGEALDLSASLLDGVAQTADREVDLASRQVDLAEGQLQALGIVNDSVLSVAEALKQYREAQDKVDQAKATPVVAPPAAQVPAAPAANSNQPAQAEIPVKQGAAFGNAGGVLNPMIGGYQYALDMRDARGGGQVDFYATDEAAIAAAERLGLGLDKVVRRYQDGGIVGNGLYGVDSVLARYQDGGFIALAGGEFVTRAPSVTAETAPLLRAINDTGRVPASMTDKAALGTQRVEALLEGLLHQSTVADRQQIDLDSRGYEAMIDRLEALLNQARDTAADRRRTAR